MTQAQFEKHKFHLDRLAHPRSFGDQVSGKAELRTRWVIGLTVVMMLVEVTAGLLFESMALLADGWHMGTHAAALGITVFAYAYARRHAEDDRYSFGTGKVSALGGFASAVSLFIVSALVLLESASRFVDPHTIRFNDAILVASIGLVVNVVSALMLQTGNGEAAAAHGHGHGGGHAHGQEHADHNLRAAYQHVLADALTSVLAIAALLLGKFLGLTWMDPAMGIVGALVIARWSVGLMRATSGVLLDAEVSEHKRTALTQAIERDTDDRVGDLHVWRIGPRHLAAIVCVVTHEPKAPEYYKELLAGHRDLVHVTVEVNHCTQSDCA